ncbi:MAG: ABC transporter substrate-binding protein [Oscillospiraceae bacterium]|nr:ABC transporter substrate-binding protein [Oscillospiraceae bacterium]
MKKTRRILSLLIVVALASLGLAACNGDTADEQVFQIGIINFLEHPALSAAYQGFLSVFEEQGINAEFDYQNAQRDAATLATIADRFVNNDVDLVLAIATPSVQAMHTATYTIPIVGTAITTYVGAGVVYSNEAPGTNVTGASDMNPIEAQIDMIFDFVPHLQTIGIIYSSNETNAVYQAGIAIAYAESLGLTVEVGTVTATAEVQQNALSIANRVDAIWIPTDNTHADAMPIIGQVSIDTGVPVFPGEENMVMNGGIATLSIDYFELGRQSGLLAIEILLHGGNPATTPIVFGKDLSLEYVVNGFMVEALGITVPERFMGAIEFPE